jgi:hypothetical protein
MPHVTFILHDPALHLPSFFLTISHIRYYTECPRRKGPNFGRVFLRSNYTDMTQNTYIQNSMVTEILAREKWTPFVSAYCTLSVMSYSSYFSRIPTLSLMQLTATLATYQMIKVYSGWKSVDNYDTCASVFVVLFNGFMSLTSYFDFMYRY